LFRERRSGSTWLRIYLSQLLRKQGYHIDDYIPDSYKYDRLTEWFKDRKQDKLDRTRILNTHFFEGLSSLDNYVNPIIIKTSRKNKLDQLISAYMGKVNNLALQQYAPKLHIPNNKRVLNMEPCTIPHDAILDFIKNQKYIDMLWNQYAQNYNSEVVYYEDLQQPHTIKVLNVHLDPMTKYHENLPKKLPYDKKEIVLNYDEVARIISENFEIY